MVELTRESHLKTAILREVTPVFQSAISPRISDAEVQTTVCLLFDLMHHKIGDPNLDGVGSQVLDCLSRHFIAREHVKLADRFEPFAKFLLKLIFPARYATLFTTLRNRFTLGEILKEFALADESELKRWSACPWQQFPPADLVGKPDFKEQAGWTLRFRNTEDHLAPDLDNVREAKLVQSVCVCFVWLTAKFRKEIEVALMVARFSSYLQSVRVRFKDVGSRYVELFADARSADEYRFLTRFDSVPDGPVPTETVEASTLSEDSRVTVVEAEPGAGKTTLLKFIAWRHTERLLAGEKGSHRVPVYIELKALSATDSILEAVTRRLEIPALKDIVWSQLILLLDGLNEIPREQQGRFISELDELVSRHPLLCAIITGRPNSFRGNFRVRLLVLRRLTDTQLRLLFRHVLGDELQAEATLIAVLQSPSLSAWVRTPLHALMVGGMARKGTLPVRGGFSEVVSRCIGAVLQREEDQASAKVIRAGVETKEFLLARLAFEIKSAGDGTFSPTRARMILGTAKAKIGAQTLDIPRFIEEGLDNHLLHNADIDNLEFAHDVYRDYFSAVELRQREELKNGLGTDFALAHFQDEQWTECIRLFAGPINTKKVLIERGAEKNPLLAWLLLKDGNLDERHLKETVALSAYTVLEGDLRLEGTANIAGACMPVLADLERADLVEQAIVRQQRILDPRGLGKLPDDERREEEAKLRQVLIPLSHGLICILRLGNFEQGTGQEGRYSMASHAAIRALKQVGAAGTLVGILASWTGKTFDPKSLVPGAVLSALLDLGVENVINDDLGDDLNSAFAEWLCRASEAGFAKAWPAYGRVLSCGWLVGIEFNPHAALTWLRKSHDGGDINGSLELAILLIERPNLATESGEGERLLRELAKHTDYGRYKLGKMLLAGEGVPKDELEGLAILLSLAEAGHSAARGDIIMHWSDRLALSPEPHISLPAWAFVFKERLKDIFGGFSLELDPE